MTLHPLDAAGTVPDPALFFARYARESAAARSEFPFACEVRYGDAPAETLDIVSAGEGTPLAVFIHGGYWRRLDKSDFSFIARGLVPHGISFASVNYGLAPATPLREIVAQCRRAVVWLSNNDARFGFDRERITAFGHSAGGYLAAMCGVTHPLHAVATLSGLHDLRAVQASFVNEWLGLDPAEAYALSPIAAQPARAFPVYATAGAHESEDGFKAQGRALVDAWTRYGCDAVYEDSPGDDHFTICLRLNDPFDPLARRIARLAGSPVS